MELIVKEREVKNLFIDDLSSYDFLLSPSSTLNLNIYIKNKNEEISLKGKVSKDANLNINLLDFSTGEIKLKSNFDLYEGASANWNLASISSNKDKKIFDISFNHIEGHSKADVKNYGVSLDESKLSFLGTNKINKNAKKSNTSQTSKVIVFDKKSNAIANPILKIDENDVLAFHSASIGKINEEHLFYLKSKGLTEKEAKGLIVSGYIKPIANIFDEEIKNHVDKLIMEKIYVR